MNEFQAEVKKLEQAAMDAQRRLRVFADMDAALRAPLREAVRVQDRLEELRKTFTAPVAQAMGAIRRMDEAWSQLARKASEYLNARPSALADFSRIVMGVLAEAEAIHKEVRQRRLRPLSV